MKLPVKKNYFVLATIPLVAIAATVLLISFHKSPRVQKSASFNTISDTSTALSFNMSKKFIPIPKDQLATLNPGFGYGFQPANDSHASCIISQIALKTFGTTTGDQLRDGILKEVKKIHPDVKLDNPATASKPAKFGAARGVLLQMTYTDGNNKIKRVEVIALGKTSEVIAYCQSLSSDSAKYYDDFTIFFSSLRLSS